jgi:hypothetical protein
LLKVIRLKDSISNDIDEVLELTKFLKNFFDRLKSLYIPSHIGRKVIGVNKYIYHTSRDRSYKCQSEP